MAPAKVRSGANAAHLSVVEKTKKPAPQEQPRVLRVGVVVSGRIIDERLISSGADVTIGGSERNDFILDDERLPSRFKVFENRGGGYRLNFTDFMEGRLTFVGGFDDLTSLRKKGKGQAKNRPFHVELAEDSRGKVVVGETTLLFQMVQRPAIAPLPQLPASVRGGWVKNVDWAFSTLLIVSFVAQFTFVLWLVSRDWPVQPAFEVHSDVIRDLFDTPPSQAVIDNLQDALGRPSETAEPTTPTPEVAEPSPIDRTPGQPHRASSGTTQRPATGELDAAAQERLRAALNRSAREALGRISIIGSNNPDANGAVANVLSGGGIQQDQDRILAEITGVRVAGRDDGTVFRRPLEECDGNCGPAADLGSLMRQNPADQDVGSGGVEEIRVTADSRPGTATITANSQGDLDPSIVRRTVASNMGGITSCYERPLQRNHTLAGRVTINFTIGEGGRVTRASAVQNTVSPEVGTCIERRIRSIRFPSPRGGPATFQFPFIFQPGQ